MGLKQQIQEADSVSEVNRLYLISKNFKMAEPKTIRQIQKATNQSLARLTKANSTQEKAKKLIADGKAVSMSEAKRLVVQSGLKQAAKGEFVAGPNLDEDAAFAAELK